MQKKQLLIFICFVMALPILGFGQAKMQKIAKLNEDLHETSGLVYYQNKYLITHNDGGNKSEIFVLDTKGTIIQTINIKDTKNKDWEDLAQHEDGRLFIGDFGNNNNDRKECEIYILPPDFLKEKSIEPEKIEFTYEDQKKFPPKKEKLNYDCEAFVSIGDKLYLFTKCRTKPFTGESRIYELPAKKGKHEAKYIGSLFLCKTGWRFCSITGADYDPVTKRLVLLSYSKCYIISNFSIDNDWSGAIKAYSLPLVKQREGVCFNGKNCLFVTDEDKKGLGGGNLYTVSIPEN